MTKIWMYTFLALLLPIPTVAEPTSDRDRYLADTIAEYRKSVDRCDELKEDAQSPDNSLLEALKAYPQRDIRSYLISREYELLDECTKDELQDLLLAIGSLEAEDDLNAETRKSLTGIKDILFAGPRLEIELRYRNLPKEMKADLNQRPFFQKPFETFDVMDRIGWE